MKKTIVKISHCELNTITDALRYAIEQTRSSNGDIQAFCTDAHMEAEDNLAMATVAEDIADQFDEVFKEGSTDFIIDVNDTCSMFDLHHIPLDWAIDFDLKHQSKYSVYERLYMPGYDMTFVMYDTYDAQTNDLLRRECVSWHYGKPEDVSLDDALQFGNVAYYD